MSAGPGAPADLAATRPEDVARLGDRLAVLGAGLGAAALGLRRERSGDWTGPASRAFDEVLAASPAELTAAEEALASAGRALLAHAVVLGRARQRAAELAARLVDADRATAAWQRDREDHRGAVARLVARRDLALAGGDVATLAAAEGVLARLPPPPARDPGEGDRAATLTALRALRAEVEASGRRAADVLRAGARDAPAPPGWRERASRAVRDSRAELRLGTAESLLQTWGQLVRAGVPRAVLDGDGWRQEVRVAADAARHLAGDPLALARAVTDWDTLRENPPRWAGHLLPDAAAAGAGGLATRSTGQVLRFGRHVPQPQDARRWSGGGGRLSPRQNAAAEAFLRHAADSEPRLRARLQDVARRVGADLAGLEHSLKSPDSFKRKLALGTPARVPSAQDFDRMRDAVRFTLVSAGDAYADVAASTHACLVAEGFELVGWKNHWGAPGYSGLNTTWRDPMTGQHFEVQLHTPESYRANTATRALYEEQRRADTPPERVAELRGRQEEIWGLVPAPAGVDGLTASRFGAEPVDWRRLLREGPAPAERMSA